MINAVFTRKGDKIGVPVTVQHVYEVLWTGKEWIGPFYDVFSRGAKPLLVARSAIDSELTFES